MNFTAKEVPLNMSDEEKCGKWSDKESFRKRIQSFQGKMKKNGITACLIQKPKSVYYFANTGQPSNLWIPVEGEPILFVRRAYELAKEQTWMKNVQQAVKFSEIRTLLKQAEIFPEPDSIVGVESDFIPFKMLEKFKKDFGKIDLFNISHLTMTERFIKSPEEIKKIRNAAQLWKKGHESILQTIEPGKKEYEISAAMEHAVRVNGGDGFVSFHRWDACLPGGGIIASGPNTWVVSGHAMTVTGVGLSPALPWGASDREIKKGDLVIADYGVSMKSYHADMARTYCVGKATNEQVDLWNKLVELHLSVVERIKPGITGSEIYNHALEYAKEMKLENCFMGVGKDRGDYIGHSIGLELDEWPVIGPHMTDPFEENEIITIEPKFMVPGLGAVMVEDDILITKNGNEIIGTVGHDLFEIA